MPTWVGTYGIDTPAATCLGDQDPRPFCRFVSFSHEEASRDAPETFVVDDVDEHRSGAIAVGTLVSDLNQFRLATPEALTRVDRFVRLTSTKNVEVSVSHDLSAVTNYRSYGHATPSHRRDREFGA